MKIPQDLSLSITNTLIPSVPTKLSSRPKPLTSAQLKEKRKNPAINIDFFTNLTKKILNDFYPKYCPNCPGKLLTKEISTQPELIRCEKCRYLTSRLSYTPLHHMKLPLWMFSYVFYESMIQHPKVLTSTEISKRLKISYKGAATLKKIFKSLPHSNYRNTNNLPLMHSTESLKTSPYHLMKILILLKSWKIAHTSVLIQ
ncbi:hypothetical protein LEP1GSC112_1945 [Leptospira interrogans serovar Pomona str. UT364]|nr:hypothetical protein LEP1GSC112_1945 [Leptospira interrogans serovar Pomona str. UT364]